MVIFWVCLINVPHGTFRGSVSNFAASLRTNLVLIGNVKVLNDQFTLQDAKNFRTLLALSDLNISKFSILKVIDIG